MKKERKIIAKEDICIIRDKSIPADVAAFMTNMTTAFISQARFRNKFAESLRKASQRIRDKMKKKNMEKFGGAHKCYKYWTEDELNYIMTSSDADEVMAEKLNRTVYAIQKRRERELKKAKEQSTKKRG